MAKKAKMNDEILNDDLLDEHTDEGPQALAVRLPAGGLQALLDEGYSVEKVVSLKQGDCLRGKLLGRGGDMQVTDPVSGVPRPIGTWRIQVAPGAIAVLKTAAQLEASLAAYRPGQELAIVRGGSTRSAKGRNVTEYMVLPKGEVL